MIEGKFPVSGSPLGGKSLTEALHRRAGWREIFKLLWVVAKLLFI
jgi:hypothetical protein